MKYFAVVLIIAMTLCSCSSTVQLKSDSENISILRNRDAEIHLKSGKSINCRQIRFNDGFVFCINQDNGDSLKIPAEDINSISCKSWLGGAFEGLFFGAGAGVGIGYAATTGLKGSDGRMGRGLAVISGGVIGGLSGLVIGGIIGHHFTLIIPKDSSLVVR